MGARGIRRSPTRRRASPNEHSGGFELTRTEAEWLKERILVRADGTLFAHLVGGLPLAEAGEPWLEPSALEAGEPIRSLLEHARRFSLVAHGASLLYNLLVGEAYERKGFTQVDDPASAYREALDDWAESVAEEREADDFASEAHSREQPSAAP